MLHCYKVTMWHLGVPWKFDFSRYYLVISQKSCTFASWRIQERAAPSLLYCKNFRQMDSEKIINYHLYIDPTFASLDVSTMSMASRCRLCSNAPFSVLTTSAQTDKAEFLPLLSAEVSARIRTLWIIISIFWIKVLIGSQQNEWRVAWPASISNGSQKTFLVCRLPTW